MMMAAKRMGSRRWRRRNDRKKLLTMLNFIKISCV